MKSETTEAKKDKKLFSIRYKLMMVFGLLAIVSTATLSFFAITIAKSLAMNKAEQHLIEKAKDTAEKINSQVDQEIIYFKTIARILLTNNSSSPFEKAKLLEKEAKLRGLIGLYFCDNNGVLYTPKGKTGYVGDRTFYKKSMEGISLVTEPYIDRVTGGLVLSISVPIYDQNNKVAGVLCADYDGFLLNKYIKDIVLGKTGEAYIVDKAGISIADKDINLVKNKYNLMKASEQDARLTPLSNFIKKVISSKKSKIYFYNWDGISKIATFAKMETTDWAVCISAPVHEFMESIDRLEIILISLGLGILGAALITTIFVSGKIVKPITATSKFIDDISSGDLTSQIDNKYANLNDEIGLIASGIQGLQNRLIDTISTIKIISTELATSSDETSATTRTFSENAQSQAAALEQINATLEEITAGMDSISDNADSQIKSMKIVTEGISFLKGVEKHIKNSVEYLADQSLDISGKTQESNSLLLTMQEQSSEIAKSSEQMLNIVKVINDVADQINLLSLNAAIESARAGEAGRGFAVVADEISKLADETQSNVKSIEENILENNAKIKQGEEIVNQSIAKLQSVTDGVMGMANSVQGVDTEIDAQTKQSDNLNSNIVEVKEKSESIQTGIQEMNAALGEITGSVSNVNQTVQATAGGSEEVAGGAEQVAKMSQQLQEKVDFFKVPE